MIAMCNVSQISYAYFDLRVRIFIERVGRRSGADDFLNFDLQQCAIVQALVIALQMPSSCTVQHFSLFPFSGL